MRMCASCHGKRKTRQVIAHVAGFSTTYEEVFTNLVAWTLSKALSTAIALRTLVATFTLRTLNALDLCSYMCS